MYKPADPTASFNNILALEALKLFHPTISAVLFEHGKLYAVGQLVHLSQ